ncbi:MAG: Protein containing Integrase, catalytic core, phage domain protein [Candidatus Uhrbacteria bacterium GW2011_GWF2_39_13]|uniref:Protein containing Integrase, catalytic core, phage domain protein n=1 Tax=Candidatus Uhrbacteria bacterium GW2011_GWF2_39_13 TaxID=1618995 RepID=A0A0G0PYE5_9BACT|nr:MAG: Protein containing Integrase, catalytic core, phage domain protein [Candidatus Uhrbacteria bacterium GW2011_GWF2_39_13]
MAGKRKSPQLRFDGRYYVANIYKPDGKRTCISFGSLAERSEGQIYSAFGKWLDIFVQQPQKVLSYKNPYEAISTITSPTGKITIGELVENFKKYASQILARMSENTQLHDLSLIRRVENSLQPYFTWPVNDFGPDELHKIQQALINHEYVQGKTVKRYTRQGINDVIKWIKRVWKWGLGRQFVNPEKLQLLEEVKSLRFGGNNVTEKAKRKRVTGDEFKKVLSCINLVVADMLRLIWLTAMRPYEICGMRPFDLIRDDPDCWLYIPGRDCGPVGKHKTMRFERVKVIPITKGAQNILNKYINDFESKEPVFSPEQAVRIFLEQKALKRKTPLSYGNSSGTNRKEHPMIQPRKKYDHNSLCRAVVRACERADVEKFVPYDLRRTAATGTRAILGKEAAKVLLGHTKTETTDIYLLEEVQEAIKMAKLLAPKMAAV